MAAKKSIPSKRTVPTLIKRHKLRTLLIVIACVGIGVFSYERYLDARNVSDMKQLLSSFEELKENIESETDQSVEIEANCGSVGKFATSYACSLVLKNSSNRSDIVADHSKNLFSAYDCELLTEGIDEYKNAVSCIISVRGANKSKSESIFYKYDISPERAF